MVYKDLDLALDDVITANHLMAYYGISRPSAVRWFAQLIEGASKGDGMRDRWTAPAGSLEALERDHMTKVSVTGFVLGGAKVLLDLGGPYTITPKAAALLLGANPDTIKRWIKKGYFPGAIRLPGPTGAWRIPKGGIELANKIITGPSELDVNFIGKDC